MSEDKRHQLEQLVRSRADGGKQPRLSEMNFVLAEISRMRSVVDAARGVINCIDNDDLVTIHDNGGGSCLHELRAALKKFDKARQRPPPRKSDRAVPT